MKGYSWSEKIFLQVNRYVGRWAFIDSLALFCAHGLIYIVALFVAGYLFLLLPFSVFLQACIVGGVASVVAYGASFLFGIFIRKERPYRVFPQAKALFHAVDGWKTFPSDHTVGAIIAVCVALVFGAPAWLGVVLFFLACLVGISRVYSGVHFPADILGGLLWGIISIFFTLWILETLGIVLYDGKYLFFL